MTLERPYCTLLDVQTETKNSGSEYDETYTQAINLASRYIETHCRRDFWYHDYTQTPYRVPRSRVIGSDVILPFPIIDITEVRYLEDATVASSSDFALSEIEYYFEEGKSTISLSSTLRINYPFDGKVEVYGEFGLNLQVDDEDNPILTAPPVNLPASIRRATTILAAAWSNERRIEQVALDGSRTQLLDNTISKEVYHLLERFINRVGNNF